jgi:hypothetical protein
MIKINNKNKKILIILAAVVILGAGGYYSYQYSLGENIEAPDQEVDVEEETTTENKLPDQEQEIKTEAPPKEPTLSDLGDFKLIYDTTPGSQYEVLNTVIKDSRIFEDMIVFLNTALILQKDFPITFKQCGFVNAYYTLDTKEIVICDELLESFADNFAYYVNTKEELNNAIIGATYFIIFHELGHGLIDIYDLTYSGKEEDVADQLASIVLISVGEDGAKSAITGANFFYITSSQIGEGYPFWDEHSLNQQRYYNILCWVYGSDQQKYGYFVGTYGLPEDRAVRCQREYEKMSEFWDVAIEPFVQEDIKKIMNQ